jgi:hypothetical protein
MNVISDPSALTHWVRPMSLHSPLAPFEGENPPLTIGAFSSDGRYVRSDTGSIWLDGSAGAIHAFMLSAEGDLHGTLTYRALLAGGERTEWIRTGLTTNASSSAPPLTGFAVQLSETLYRRYALVVIGAFRGEAGLRIARAGEDCVTESGNLPLCGMQIILRPLAGNA